MASHDHHSLTIRNGAGQSGALTWQAPAEGGSTMWETLSVRIFGRFVASPPDVVAIRDVDRSLDVTMTCLYRHRRVLLRLVPVHQHQQEGILSCSAARLRAAG
jgi:hypothetical protein